VLESLPVVLIIGTALGFLAGIGVGGGSLLILWLTLVLGMDHPQARIINLLFFLPSAIVSSIFRWKQGKLEIKKVLPAIIVGCVAAGVCSFLSSSMDISLLQKLFGGLLILTGIRELLYKPRTKKQEQS
jgi:uncharacterized membrane protein YfcA